MYFNILVYNKVHQTLYVQVMNAHGFVNCLIIYSNIHGLSANLYTKSVCTEDLDHELINIPAWVVCLYCHIVLCILCLQV
jgi:hypothetical protein